MSLASVHTDGPTTYVTNADTSGDVTNGAISMLYHRNLLIQHVISGGTPVADLYLQISLDGTNWTNVLKADGTAVKFSVTSSDTVYTFEITDAGGGYYRTFYDRASGGQASGMNAKYSRKNW